MIKELDELYSILIRIIEQECDNRNFIKKLREKFLEKGLNASIPNQILSESLPLRECNTIILMCFTEGCKEFFGTYFHKNGVEGDLDLKSYFGESMISSYVGYINAEVEPTAIELDNVIQDPKNPNRFIAGFVPYKTISDWQKYYLTTYDFDMQREPKYQQLPNEETMKLKNINEKAVQEMTELMCNDEFEPNMITYTILMVNGREPQVFYNKKTMKFRIEPNYSYDDIKYTSVNLIDGQHRVSAGARASFWAEKHNEELTGSFHCVFYVMTKEEAREYIKTQAKQNSISEEFIETLETNDYTEFVNKMNSYKNEKKNIFKNNIASTHAEMEAYHKLTYNTILIEALKQTKINVSSNIDKKFASEKFTEIVTTLIDYMKKEFYDDDIEKMKDENIFLTPNIFLGYLALAEQLWEDNDYIDKLLSIALTLQDDKVKDKLKEFKLTSKNIDGIKRNIFNYFKVLVISLNSEEQEG